MAEFPNLNVNGGVVTSLSSPEAAGPLFTSPKRYYLTRDGKAVGEDSPDRHTLLVAEGGTIPLAHARELGLVEGDQTEAEAGVSGAPRLAPEPPKEGTVARESAEESRVPAPAPARPAAPRPQGK